MKKESVKKEGEFCDELVSLVKEDFEKRRNERRRIEQQWRLNMNYLAGNQYCEITPNGDVCEEDEEYYWQRRNVFNHVAPIVETRVAKLARVRPIMSVRAAGSDESDLKTARISSEVLNATCLRVGLDAVISKATLWSETLGSAFYKVVWNPRGGKRIGDVDGEEVREGDVELYAVSPFEIFPDCLYKSDISEVKSLIHARVVSVSEIEEEYGVIVEGRDIDVFSLSGTSAAGCGRSVEGALAKNSVILIERYERPTKKFPKGRVVAVAGDKLLYVSELPFFNGKDGERDFPFVKQDSNSQAGAFFGVSVIERIIPLQRAYNAVKNRKHEFLNRVSVGVLTVEDGSVDTDALAEEGLAPGKVVVYRQGSRPPEMMSAQSVPVDFTYEENRLSDEFITISGVSEISRSSSLPTTATSGVALQLLVEQDETRLSVTAENVRRAVKEVGKHIIRLFKQYATDTRLMRIAGDNKKSEVFYFNASDLTSDDVVFDTENELSFTPAQKKSGVYDLLATGLLADGDGRMNPRTKAKLLEILGYGSIDCAQDLTNLHVSKASGENVEFVNGEIEPEEFDDHSLHVTEHTRFLLSGEAAMFDDPERVKRNALSHLRAHKAWLKRDDGGIGDAVDIK